MGVLTDVRALIRDSVVPQRFSDADLTVFINEAIGEMNAWCNTTYVLADYDALTPPIYQRQLMLKLAKMKAVEVDLQDPKRYIKLVTQDTQYDASDVGLRLQAMLSGLRKDFIFCLKKWYGIDSGGYFGTAGNVDGEASTDISFM